jgi:hypothetical protein
MTAVLSWRQLLAFADGTRASPLGAVIVRPALPGPVPDTMVAAGWMIALAAIIAVGVAAAVRWPSVIVDLAYRAGHAAGVVWATLRSFGAWLLESLKRTME